MSYRALFVDIDGTILETGKKEVNRVILEEFEKLQSQGVKVVIATGRTRVAVTPEILQQFQPDYFICANGASVMNADNSIVWEKMLSKNHVEKIVDYFSEIEEGVLGFSFPDGYYIYFDNQAYKDFYNMHSDEFTHFYDGKEKNRHLEELPFSGWGILPKDEAERFNEKHQDLRMLHFTDNMFDITQADINKSTGTRFLLEHMGMKWDDIVFVGDGYNDVELLQLAGLGVAMGNADDAIKEVADVVTASVQQDGVYHVIKKYFQ